MQIRMSWKPYNCHFRVDKATPWEVLYGLLIVKVLETIEQGRHLPLLCQTCSFSPTSKMQACYSEEQKQGERVDAQGWSPYFQKGKNKEGS